MGFEDKVVSETLDQARPGSKYAPKGQEINYFGYAETELKPYVQDLFEEAAQKKTRIFLSHVTSTTHHPWTTPEDFKMEFYMGEEGTVDHDPMNNYLNTQRFVDDWLGDIMTMLDETGIANSTLVVVVGDHGQAFGEDNEDITGTYENGHISNFRVPLVFRHPHMPRIDITANATSISIIPTILDLLVQSGSLDARDSEIASSLLPEYQGQSLIRPFVPAIGKSTNSRSKDAHSPRPIHKHQDSHIQRVWNLGLINAGGSMVSVTSADTPYRLILPIREGFEYVFTHLDEDPGELHPMKTWTLSELVGEVSSKFGEDPASWLEDAEQVGKWYVNEQRRIWGYREK
jgi:arylsulfatase A-like enzyme